MENKSECYYLSNGRVINDLHLPNTFQTHMSVKGEKARAIKLVVSC